MKKGCFLAPTRFFSIVLKQANVDLDDANGVFIRHCYDDSLFYSGWLQTRPHEDPEETELAPTFQRRCCSRCPQRKSLAAPNFLLYVVCRAFWSRSQPEEDGGPSPSCTSKRSVSLPPPRHIKIDEIELIPSSGSPTWVAPSYGMVKSTKKSTTDWLRQRRRSLLPTSAFIVPSYVLTTPL